jgi:hypothetical protein
MQALASVDLKALHTSTLYTPDLLAQLILHMLWYSIVQYLESLNCSNADMRDALHAHLNGSQNIYPIRSILISFPTQHHLTMRRHVHQATTVTFAEIVKSPFRHKSAPDLVLLASQWRREESVC